MFASRAAGLYGGLWGCPGFTVCAFSGVAVAYYTMGFYCVGITRLGGCPPAGGLWLYLTLGFYTAYLAKLYTLACCPITRGACKVYGQIMGGLMPQPKPPGWGAKLWFIA
jgi:hypothetical protein